MVEIRVARGTAYAQATAPERGDLLLENSAVGSHAKVPGGSPTEFILHNLFCFLSPVYPWPHFFPSHPSPHHLPSSLRPSLFRVEKRFPLVSILGSKPKIFKKQFYGVGLLQQESCPACLSQSVHFSHGVLPSLRRPVMVDGAKTGPDSANVWIYVMKTVLATHSFCTTG